MTYMDTRAAGELIDTHCHLASKRYTDMTALRVECEAMGLTHCVSQGTSPTDWDRTLAQARDMPDLVSACLAVHPSDCTEVTEEQWSYMRELCHNHKLAAIGETGLDYYWNAPEGWEDASFRARQRSFLERHFELARELGLNISLHTRDKVGAGSACFEDAFAIALHFPTVRPVFHCFIGTQQQAERIFVDLNGMVSFTGLITFKKTEQVQTVAAWCPEDRIMIETDSPFLSPEPHRGEPNIPGRVRLVAQKLAELRKISFEQICRITSRNAHRFFRLPN